MGPSCRPYLSPPSHELEYEIVRAYVHCCDASAKVPAAANQRGALPSPAEPEHLGS